MGYATLEGTLLHVAISHDGVGIDCILLITYFVEKMLAKP